MFFEPALLSVLISYGQHNKLPQIAWLNTTMLFLCHSIGASNHILAVQKPRSWLGHGLWEICRGVVPYLVPAPDSGSTVPGVPWLEAMSPPVCAFVVT